MSDVARPLPIAFLRCKIIVRRKVVKALSPPSALECGSKEDPGWLDEPTRSPNPASP